ncbi:hypothetical protein CTAYLR_003792 [Chrysophaeum taylorii]|uniref:EF-hand domain-containing protein n=1 Tax=Chrysophaeum taylorii TaxID=2483200 RepID=A0AAD7UCX0_9STRA|nr:hypothetical protein CTAYLR_003792 [Chrysophaeum taylorii]
MGLGSLEPKFFPRRAPRQKWSLEKLMDVLSLKFATQSSSVRRAFRGVAVPGEDRINPEQLKRWLHSLNLGVGAKLSRRLFDKLDKDGSGTISYEEFRSAFGETISGAAYEGREFVLGETEHAQRVRTIFEAAKRRKTPLISVDECVRVLRERMASQHSKVQRAFRSLDKDHSGYLERQEFERMLAIHNVRLAPIALDELIKRITSEPTVSYEAFKKFFGEDIAGTGFQNSTSTERVCDHDHAWGKANAAFAAYMSSPKRPKPLAKLWTPAEFLATLEMALSSRSKSARRIFRMVDADQSGHIDAEEFHRAMLKLNINLSPAESKRFFLMFDEDNSGSISYAELTKHIGSIVSGYKDTGVLTMKAVVEEAPTTTHFVDDARRTRPAAVSSSSSSSSSSSEGIPAAAAAARYALPQMKELIARRLGNKYLSACAAFREIDKDHTGTLSEDEIRAFLKNRNIEFHDEDFKVLMSDIGRRDDGRVQYDEFVRSFGEAICGAPWESAQQQQQQTSLPDLAAEGPPVVSRAQSVLPTLGPEEALQKLREKLGETTASVNRLFKRYNKGRAGKLDPDQVALMFKNYNLEVADIQAVISLVRARHREEDDEEIDGGGGLSYRVFAAEFGPSIAGHRYEGLVDPFADAAYRPITLPPPAQPVTAEQAKTMLLRKLATNFAHARRAFVNFNTVRDNVLDLQELRAGLEKYHIRMEDAEYDKFASDYHDGSGEIQFDAFVQNVGKAVCGDQDQGLSITLKARDDAIKLKRKEFEASFQEIGDADDPEEDEEKLPSSSSKADDDDGDDEAPLPPVSEETPPPPPPPQHVAQDKKLKQTLVVVSSSSSSSSKKKRPPAAARRRRAALNNAKTHWRVVVQEEDYAAPETTTLRTSVSAPRIVCHHA